MEAPALTPKVCPACNSRYGNEVAFCSRDGTPLVVDPGAGHADLVGTVLAERYRIVRLLGEGGMGQVYEAQHLNINKRFAIKLLRPEIVSNQEAVARFRQEAWSASSIGDENIVEIDDFATLPNGSVYLAMEYLQGRALSDRMRTPPPVALDEALDLLMQVCRGLSAAHAKGIVHRDMKPENVFLAEKHGRVIAKILDFGIAKVSGAEGSQSLTRTGTIFGTPHYMSPEQALGRALDHRTDIYSVGVIMYELFTGRVPFEAESFMGILTKHITVEPMAPHLLSPERNILPEVEAVILRAMAKEVADRYQTMNELLGELLVLAEQHAPNVLRVPSGSISAQVSSQMPSATPSSPRAAPSTPLPPSMKVQAATSSVDIVSGKERRAGVLVGAAVALVGLVTAVVLFSHAPATTTDRTPVAEKKVPVVEKKVPVVEKTSGQPTTLVAKDVTILIDSEPARAEILRGDVRFGDTPANIVLVGGKAETIVLRKAGYVTQAVTLKDDSDARKIVRLARVASTRPKDTPPPFTTAPTKTPPAVKPPTVKHQSEDPKKGSEIINPY
ncbi:MAG: protein kinase [Polyangia bacterium]